MGPTTDRFITPQIFRISLGRLFDGLVLKPDEAIFLCGRPYVVVRSPFLKTLGDIVGLFLRSAAPF